MGRSSVYNVQSLPDAALSYNFDLFFASIPGASDTMALTYKCQTAALPGFGLEAVNVDLHGVTKKEAGRAIYTHTIAATFLEVVDFSTRDTFRKWQQTARSWKNNTGSNSSVYKVNGYMDLYDNSPIVTRTVKILGIYPENVDDVQLSGAEGTAVMLSVTFSFDWTDEGD